jgi:hypothetical protein
LRWQTLEFLPHENGEWDAELSLFAVITAVSTIQEHGKQIEELLDLIERFLDYSCAGTFDQRAGEMELWDASLAVLRRYRPATAETS